MHRFHRLCLLGLVAMAAGLCLSSAASARVISIPLPPPGAFSTTIDNPYWPLPMASSFAYRAETEDGCEYNKVSVTMDTHFVTVDGQIYTTLIVRDQEWEDEECDFEDVVMVEDTHDYYAQEHVAQNVWYFGEETYAVDDETPECSDEGSWEAGLPLDDPEVDPAQPGIVMLGAPRPGDRYRQEYLEDEAEDWGAVMRLNAKVSIGVGEFVGCLMNREWTHLEPGHIEHKLYCPLAGNPGPAGLMLIQELKGKNVYVEYIGADFGVPLPGEGDAFPSSALDCELP